MTKCSFCGKNSSDVGPMVEGPDEVYICANCVELSQRIIRDEKRKAQRSTRMSGGIRAPRQIKELLDQAVVGHECAKKGLAVALHNHLQRVTRDDSAGQRPVASTLTSNVLLIGPIGSGKSLLARAVAQSLDLPFAMCDAASLVDGGEHAEDVLFRLLQKAEYDLEAAQRGVVIVDNIDKLAGTSLTNFFRRDVVAGTGVQYALVGLLEGRVANVPPQGGRRAPEQQCIQMDTSQILFICSGTFSGLEAIIRKRVEKDGPCSGGVVSASTGIAANLLSEVRTGDLVEFGMNPEFLARLPVVLTLEPLNAEAMSAILGQGQHALVREYQDLCRMGGCELEFTPGAIKLIAAEAIGRGTGGHALRSVCAEVMLDLLYALPDTAAGGRRTIDEQFVRRQICRGGQRVAG